MRDVLIVVIGGYLLGNLQASYLLGKWLKKVDIRTLGRGNAGASNAVESLGWKFGLAVAVIDILKGVLSIVLVKWFFNLAFDASGVFLLYLNGYSVILGHIFPFYMNFKGGKGTATLIGVLLGLDIWVGLIGLLIIITVTWLTDYIALGTLVLTVYVVLMTGFKGFGFYAVIISILGFFLSLKLHLPNYKRIKAGTESRLTKVWKDKLRK